AIQRLITEQRPDALDGLEVVAAQHRPRRAAVRERLVDREVEPVLTRLELRAVERALAGLEREPAAGRAAPRAPVAAVLVEQQLDAPIGCRLERVGPARRRAAVTAGLLLPALERVGLFPLPPPLEDRSDEVEQLVRARVRLGLR